MYAIVQTGSKQYRVRKGDVIQVELLNAQPGEMVDLSDVLLVGQENGQIKFGAPTVAGSAVTVRYRAVVQGPKGHSVKYKRRKGEYRKFGFRQKYSEVEVVDIKV